jgi:peptide/nickel transport system substrate-binding protein
VQTVVVKAKLDENGKAVNPLIVAAYLSTNYVIQKAWTEALEAMSGGDATQLLADTAEDVVYSGPYTRFFADDTKVVLVRDDNLGAGQQHVGQIADGQVSGPHDLQGQRAGTTALQAGEVDVSQQFNSNVQDLWLKQDLPISTYLPEAPVWHRCQLADGIFQLEVTWFGPAGRCARRSRSRWTIRRSSPMP